MSRYKKTLNVVLIASAIAVGAYIISHQTCWSAPYDKHLEASAFQSDSLAEVVVNHLTTQNHNQLVKLFSEDVKVVINHEEQYGRMKSMMFVKRFFINHPDSSFEKQSIQPNGQLVVGFLKEKSTVFKITIHLNQKHIISLVITPNR